TQRPATPTQQMPREPEATQPLERPRPVSFYAGDATGRRRRDLSAPLAAQFRRVAALVTQYRPQGVRRLRDDDRRGPRLLQPARDRSYPDRPCDVLWSGGQPGCRTEPGRGAARICSDASRERAGG